MNTLGGAVETFLTSKLLLFMFGFFNKIDQITQNRTCISLDLSSHNKNKTLAEAVQGYLLSTLVQFKVGAICYH